MPALVASNQGIAQVVLSHLLSRIQATLARHLRSGKAALQGGSTIPDARQIASWKLHVGTAALGCSDGPSPAAAPQSVCQPADDGAPIPEVSTIVFANEFFDALPVEIISPRGSLRIDSQQGGFIETWAPASTQELEFLDRYAIHPGVGERVEAPLQAQQFMEQIASSLNNGFLIVIDYGYTREEQLGGRHRGTVKAIRQHSISANPYEAPGEQDITADVNFTALAVAAENHGMRTHTLLTQSQFLMGIGEDNQFADAFEGCQLPQERAKVALQLKHLVTPAGMGESFQVLIGCKGITKETMKSLSGLSFGRRTR